MEEGKDNPGVRDGTGPASGSYQKKKFGKGKRQMAGEPCPKKKAEEVLDLAEAYKFDPKQTGQMIKSMRKKGRSDAGIKQTLGLTKDQWTQAVKFAESVASTASKSASLKAATGGDSNRRAAASLGPDAVKKPSKKKAKPKKKSKAAEVKQQIDDTEWAVVSSNSEKEVGISVGGK